MTIREQEDQLFDEWLAERAGLVRDGLVDESKWSECPRKILLLMKEINGARGGTKDLRGTLGRGAQRVRNQTWDTVARWVEGIQNLPNELAWATLKKPMTKCRRQAALQKIAVINIKKSPGGHTADDDEVFRVASADHRFLKRQYQLYKADVVILCGAPVVRYYKKHFSPSEGVKWSSTRRGVSILKEEPEKIVVAYSHPAARGASHLLHYPLMDALAEVCFGARVAGILTPGGETCPES